MRGSPQPRPAPAPLVAPADDDGEPAADCLRDESRLTGWAEAVFHPSNEDDLRRHLREAARDGRVVTVQGARTGIAGGAVPRGGRVLNLDRMNRILDLRQQDGLFLLRVQPGLTLSALRAALDRYNRKDSATLDPALRARLHTAPVQFFAPDPTEAGASLGGMASTNASGARSFLYGPMRGHVQSLRLILADGSVLLAQRGEPRAQGRRFSITDENGRALRGELPAYAMPAVKNAAGYFARDDMDMMDLFIGAEGTLGLIAELEIRLLPAPPVCWGLLMFFPDEEAAVEAVFRIREKQGGTHGVHPNVFAADRLAERAHGALAAMEFFDSGALDLLRAQKKAHPSFAGGLPSLPAAWHTGLYLEYHADREADAEAALLDAGAVLGACGGSEDDSWLACDERAMARLKAFRHAVPEAVNLVIDERRKQEPGIAKLGTDLAVPDVALPRMLELYRQGLRDSQLAFVKFGHIGDNHIHVNILPRDRAQYEAGRQLYRDWAQAAVKLGGSVSAEHGIGKLKTELLAIQYGEPGLRQMQAVKTVFDPAAVLNPGNLFPPPSV
jgi:D-lactate dehydrogenase (cytochrome)